MEKKTGDTVCTVGARDGRYACRVGILDTVVREILGFRGGSDARIVDSNGERLNARVLGVGAPAVTGDV